MLKSLFRVGVTAAVLVAPSLAFAHTGHGQTMGVAEGFLHPLTGVDHVLAMAMVGALAFQMGGRARLLLPATFVLVMAFGGALGLAGVSVPLVEAGITASILILGGAIVTGFKAPLPVATAVIGLFGVFHGFAHGAEMPETAGALGYAGGFMLASALLHAVGFALAGLVSLAAQKRAAVAVRVRSRTASRRRP